jgi:outer membrane protein
MRDARRRKACSWIASFLVPVWVALPGAAAEPAEASAEATAPPDLPAARPISLDDALAYAHAHQPAIQAALARVQTEEANARIPRAQWQPTLGATAQIFGATSNNTTATYIIPEGMALPRIGGSAAVVPAQATWKPYASTVVGASLLQEVFDFGRIAAAAAAADAKVEVQKQG